MKKVFLVDDEIVIRENMRTHESEPTRPTA